MRNSQMNFYLKCKYCSASARRIPDRQSGLAGLSGGPKFTRQNLIKDQGEIAIILFVG